MIFISVKEIFIKIRLCNRMAYVFKEHVKIKSAKWRAQRALRAHVLYAPYVPMRPTCPRAQVYFTEGKIRKWKFCTHTFLKVLSLILNINLRNYRFIETG